MIDGRAAGFRAELLVDPPTLARSLLAYGASPSESLSDADAPLARRGRDGVAVPAPVRSAAASAARMGLVSYPLPGGVSQPLFAVFQ